jgi:deazaflavin-dependent oxidoreductase (nitroreductase family)
MPLPRRLARFNRVATNRVTMAFAGWAPGMAIIEHVGRKSGKAYRTPVNAFRRGDTLTFALTYGPGSEWVRNVLAAGGCTARIGGETLRLIDPRLIHDEQRRAVPPFVRLVLRVLGAADFLELRVRN